MSQENVEIVRRAYEAAVRRPKPDFATVNALFHPDHEFVSPMASRIEADRQPGTRGFRSFLDTFGETWESWEITVDQVRSIDDQRALVFGVLTAVGRQGGVPVEQRFAQVASIRDGKVTRTEVYSSPEEALEAVGLAE